MRRLITTAVVVGVLLAALLGFAGAAPAGAEVSEIEIVTQPADPELSARRSPVDERAESALATTFIVVLLVSSVLGPWLLRPTDRSQPRLLPVRVDDRRRLRAPDHG